VLPENIAGEGHSAVGWGMCGSVIAADCRVQSPIFYLHVQCLLIL